MRAKSVSNLYSKKHDIFNFKHDSIWSKTLGKLTKTGIILIYGKEKNGKTWFALLIAKMFSAFERVLYVSAEEGDDIDFINSLKRAKIDTSDSRLQFIDYVSITELTDYISRPKSHRIIVIDNMTVYQQDFRNGKLLQFLHQHPDKLFILLAHQERNDPYPSSAADARRWAKRIVRVEGLTAFISGRCPGGVISIDEKSSKLYHGNSIEEKQNQDA